MTCRLTPIVGMGLLLSMAAHCQSLFVPTWDTFQYSDSVSIRYFQAGSGSQPVVLLHGLASSSFTWLDMLLALRCDCTFYALDLKGHGGSSKPNDHAYGLTDNAAIVRAFLDSHRLHHVVLVGHSYGGAVALRSALDAAANSNRVKALVLLGTPGTNQHFPLTMTALRYQRPARFFERFTPPEFAAWVALRHVYYNRDSVTPVRIALYASLWRDPAGNRAMRETGSDFLSHGLNELAPHVHEIAVPTLVIAGDHDRIVRPKHQRKLARIIPHAQYVPLARCGHVPQEELPDETARTIGQFLDTLVAK